MTAQVGIPAPTLAIAAQARMEHRIGPAQLLLSELLVLSSADLERRVAAELDANAALELPTVPSCPSCGRPMWRDECPCADYRSSYLHRTPTDQADRLTRIAVSLPAREQLLVDAAPLLRPAERRIAAHLLADVDDLGVLTEPVAAVAARLDVTAETVRRVIDALRASGTPGLCAESLAERLNLQVSAAAEAHAVPPEVRALLGRGLGVLAEGGVRPAATACGLAPGQVGEALAWIRAHITAEVFGGDEEAAPAQVDLVVRRAGDRLLAHNVPGPWSALRVAESYLAAATDPLVQRDVLRARRFVEVLDRRSQTMLRVAQAVITHQARRMIAGARAQRPLLRRDVAAELGLHESTVSRAVAAKHLLLPSGEIVAFGSLFGTGQDAQQCLRELVAGETVARSDAELARALGAAGHAVARRTVAKYRAALGIPQQNAR